MGSVEQRPALRGVNPQMTEIKGHPFVQVDVDVPIMHPGDTKTVEHLFIPLRKVPKKSRRTIQEGQVEAILLNNSNRKLPNSWRVTEVQLRLGHVNSTVQQPL